jgi:thiol-disulfide isomerase/thioredoxin
MNKSLFHLVILVTLFSCKKEEKENLNEIENLTGINLHFKGYNPFIHKRFIDLTIENSINPIKKQLSISDSGIVSYNFINPKKTELVFQYDMNGEFSLIASPNEEIEGHLNFKDLLEGSKFSEFEITGTNQAVNELILANTIYLDSLIKTSSPYFTRNGSTPDVHYKVRRIGEMKNQLLDFEKFITKNNINNEQFIDWSTSKIRYSAGYDLCSYPYFGPPINKDLSIENDYFNFLQEVKPNRKNLIVYQSYLSYVKALSTFLLIMSNVSDRFESERKQLKRDSSSNFPIVFDIIKGLSEHQDRELIMAFAYQKAKKASQKYQDSVKLFVNNRLAAQLFKSEIIESKPISDLLEEYGISRNEKDELLALYRETKNRVVFHDFWFASCGPCVQELPNYSGLMKSMDSEVVFIFYGLNMNEEEWKTAVKKFGLRGKHHLLTKNQLAFFERYFELNGFPHHQIINAKGQIVNEEIPKVTPDNFDRIKKLIRKNDI